MGAGRGNHFKFQVFRSEARETAKNEALVHQGLRDDDIDASQIRVEPIGYYPRHTPLHTRCL